MIHLSHTSLVLTSATRTYDVEKAYQSLLQREDIGFYKLPQRQAIWDESQKKGTQLREKFSRLIVLGIGGSSLGPQTLLKALAPNEAVEVWDSVDPIAVEQLWNKLVSPETTHFLAISKSGNTMETLALINFVAAQLQEKGLKVAEHFSVITTCNQNYLHRWALDNGLDVTDFPTDVGGRFSVLTAVGLIPAAFAGIDLKQLQKGAAWVVQEPKLVQDLAVLTLESFAQQKWITVFWAYPDALSLLGDWIRQLWAESLAKSQDRLGNRAPRASTPFLCQGTKDQHSVLQQLSEGHQDKFVWFIKSLNTENYVSKSHPNLFPGAEFLNNRGLNDLLKAEAQATQDALIAQGVPTLTLVTENTSGYEVGAYFMLFEMLIGLIGESLNLNAFDQPGVELGKKLAIKSLLAK